MQLRAFLPHRAPWAPLILFAGLVHAQPGVDTAHTAPLPVAPAAAVETPAPAAETPAPIDTAAALPAVPAETSYPLLPTPLGPIESVMWSEHGLMRRAFDLPLTREEREKELGFRRNMLGLHQIGGFTTFAALAATVVLGQLTYNGDRDLAQMHIAMAWTAVTAYFTTASLALLTPPPAIRRGEWSTVSTHKLLAGVHFTGMIVTPLLGTMAHNNRDVQTIHLTSAYITTAAFGAALLVITF